MFARVVVGSGTPTGLIDSDMRAFGRLLSATSQFLISSGDRALPPSCSHARVRSCSQALGLSSFQALKRASYYAGVTNGDLDEPFLVDVCSSPVPSSLGLASAEQSAPELGLAMS